jgi:two-component system, LytTR family, sensor kinase
MKRKNEISLHCAFWILFILNSILTYDSEYLHKYGFLSIGFKQATFYLVVICVFYLNYAYLIPRYLAERRYYSYAAGIIALEALALTLFILHAWFLDWYFSSGDFFVKDRISGLPYLAFQTFFYIVVAIGTRFTRDWFRYHQLRRELEEEKLKSELSLLGYQLNPHFLFNSLNNIYSLTMKNSAHVPDAILRLSDLMRYSLAVSTKSLVPLDEEIAYLHSFIELRKLQLVKPDLVTFSITGRTDEVELPPMLLIPFVENAFKHGDIYSQDAYISIRLDLLEDMLIFVVENKVLEGPKDVTKGIGLENVRRRIELMYPGRHTLDIQPGTSSFRAKFQLKVK